jgi:hypothetical protein
VRFCIQQVQIGNIGTYGRNSLRDSIARGLATQLHAPFFSSRFVRNFSEAQ